MLLVLAVICIPFIIWGAVRYVNAPSPSGYDWKQGTALIATFSFLLGIIIIALIPLTVSLSRGLVINETIAMYESENVTIQSEISEIVEGYKEHEKEVFDGLRNESPIVLVGLYPELKSDELVNRQIDIYVANNQKIKELRETQINKRVKRWWIYFGR